MTAAAAEVTASWPNPEPEFLTRKEAAALARRSVWTIKEWQRKELIGTYGPPGGKRLVRTSELRRYLFGE